MNRRNPSLGALMLGLVAACGGSGGGGSSASARHSLSFTDTQALLTIPATTFASAIGNMALTIELWVRVDGISDTPTSKTDFVGALDDTVTPSRAWEIGMTTTPSGPFLIATIWNSNGAQNLLAPAPATGEWTHVALTYNGVGVRLIVDGTEAASSPFSGVVPTVDTVFLGTWASGSHGLIDEVRIWSTARSVAQVDETRSQILPGSTPDLVGYWRFEEGAGQVASDTSTFGSEGGLGATPGPDASDPEWSDEGAPVQ